MEKYRLKNVEKVEQVEQLICLRIWKKNPNIGIALQSNLYRTTNDLQQLMSRGISIRLIKGAYKEDITKSYQRNKFKVKAFLRLAPKLLSNNGMSYFYFSNNHSIKKYNPKKSKNIIKTLFKYFLCTNFWILRFIEQYGFKNIIAIIYIHNNYLIH